MPPHEAQLSPTPHALTDEERDTYGWQTSIPNFGEEGQQRLKAASVLVSRIGGVGGAVAWSLAAAGVGKLVLAHAGNSRPDDLNRQTLMSHAELGQPRVRSAERRLREFNPRLEIETFEENITSENAARLMARADVVVSCAPLFEERLAMNAAAVAQGKPMIDCAMYELSASVMTILPGRSACLACLCPAPPPAWRRRFPVLGAVAHMIGAWGAMEAIKVITGLGEVLADRMLLCDMKTARVDRLALQRNPGCLICSSAPPCPQPIRLNAREA